jgi:4-amino-4-deoxy-L-arabinose transferase-like glycosyltransferase
MLVWRDKAMASATTTQTSTAASRSHLPWIVGLAIVARVLVAVVFFRLADLHPLTNWGYENVSIALAIIGGQGYASPFFFPSGPTAFMPPGYPALIAGFMRIFGTGLAATSALIAFQFLLSIVTVVLVQRTASRYFGVRTGNFAGLICALAEPLLIAPLYIWDTCLSAVILVVVLAIAPNLRSKRDFAFAGFACAIIALINPALLPTLLAIAAWTAWRARMIPWLGILVFLVAFSPWPIRNFAVMHAFIPLRSNFGYELWQGNHAGGDGENPALNTPAVNASERSLFRAEGEIRYMHQKGALAKSWIEEHPGEFAGLTVRRFARFWMGSSKSPAPMTIPLSAAALIGLVLLWRSRQVFVLFALPLVIFPLPYYMTHADLRFQFVLDPLLAILAGYACESFIAWCSRRPVPSPALAPSAH